MSLDDSKDLLRRFSRNRSEAAFRELVQRHSPLVYSTALRQLNGDRAAAEDVMQEVFTLLVRKAPGLGGVVLSGWLYRQSCRRAANHARSESRRRRRELAVAASVMGSTTEPPDVTGHAELCGEIDNALLSLSTVDRDAVTMRFFEGRDYRSLGSSLGLSEEAARKRVTRALDKLAAVLKRKGIVAGAVSLGSTMTGMAATQPSAAVISRITAQALKAVPAGVSASLTSLLKFFLAGLLTFATTAAVAAAFLRPGSPVPPVAGGAPAIPGGARGSRTVAEVSTGPFDELISGIKRLHSGPAHILTATRLQALLESLPTAQMPDFFAVAGTKLTLAEKSYCYPRLLELWSAADPVAALNFTLDQDLDHKVDTDQKGRLLAEIFTPWCSRDRQAAGDWLLSVWSHENLAATYPSFLGKLRNSLGSKVANEIRGGQGAGEALKFVGKIPAPADQRAVLSKLVGRDYFYDLRPDARLDLYRALKSLPDPKLAAIFSEQWLRTWLTFAPGELQALRSSLTPRERFEISMRLFGAVPPQVAANGSTRISGAARVDLHRLEADCMNEGQAAGLTRRQVLQAVGEMALSPNSGEWLGDVRAWLALHPGEVDLDQAVLERVRAECAGYMMTGHTTQESIGIDWASSLADTELRLQASRGAFLRMVARQTPEDVQLYLNRTDLPAGLSAEFHRLFEGKP